MNVLISSPYAAIFGDPFAAAFWTAGTIRIMTAKSLKISAVDLAFKLIFCMVTFPSLTLHHIRAAAFGLLDCKRQTLRYFGESTLRATVTLLMMGVTLQILTVNGAIKPILCVTAFPRLTFNHVPAAKLHLSACELSAHADTPPRMNQCAELKLWNYGR